MEELDVDTQMPEKSELEAILRTGASSSQSNEDLIVLRSVM